VRRGRGGSDNTKRGAIFSAARIGARVAELGRQISRACGGKRLDVVITMDRGSYSRRISYATLMLRRFATLFARMFATWIREVMRGAKWLSVGTRRKRSVMCCWWMRCWTAE